MEKTINIEFETSDLSVYIKGGNRMHAFKDRLILEGVAKDIDVDESL